MNMKKRKKAFSDKEGPICPCCNFMFTADDAMYYDELGFELECSGCGKLLKVIANINVTWTSYCDD